MISEAHKQLLQLKYGLPEPLVNSLEESGNICSLSPAEISSHLGRTDITSSGFLVQYPGECGASTVRLDNPPIKDGRPQKYLRRSGESNHLFNPGVEISQVQEIWIVEGELKALCGYAHDLPVVALSGVYNWRTAGSEAELLADGEKLKDEEALLPELAQINWSGKKINLLYDSDITPGHKAYPAFERLAEQLYRLGAEKVRVVSLPSISQGQKTGLDEFILARGPAQALQDFQAIKERKEPYLPTKAGALRYAERFIRSEDLEDKLKATVAYLGAKGKVFALEWLKEHGIKGETRSALLLDAKERLIQLQIRPKVPSSQEVLPDLGPEYAQVRALIQPFIDEYDIDDRGRIGKVDWVETNSNDGTPKLHRILKHICNFAAWPIREILKDSGDDNPERYLELEGLLEGGIPLRAAKINSTDFSEKNSWAIQLWGAKAAIKPYCEKDLRYIVQLMAKEIPETTVYTHLGWRKVNGSWIYLHAGGAIGSEAVEVEINPRLGRYSFPSEVKDLKKAVQASLSLLDLGPKKLTYPSLALVYLAPLMETLRIAGIEPGFLLYLWGITGSLKSTWLALLLNHYGETFNNKSLPASFRDTANSIEGLAFLVKDGLLVVDDLYPSSDPIEKRKQSGILDTLGRNQGDRRGRGRMKADTSLREGLPPRGLALCSGEIMTLQGSSQPRGLILKIQKGEIDFTKLTVAQDQRALLSESMRGYIEYLAPQIDQFPSQLSEDFHNLRSQAQSDSKVRARHQRLNEIVAHLYLGLNFYIKFAISIGAITQEEGEEKLLEAWGIFNEIVDDQAKLAAGEEPVKRFFDTIKEQEAQGRVFFASMEDGTPEPANITPGAVKLGWGPDESGIYYLLYGPALETVVRSLRTQEESLLLSKNSLLDAFEQKELLALKQGDRRSIKKTIAGTEYRVLPISEKAFSLEDDDYV